MCGEVGTVADFNVAVLLAVIVVWRLRRRTEARSRFDEKLTVVIVLALGVLIAPTPVGQGILNILRQLASGVTQAS
ncbi:hypothetical protein F8144_30110 [Streptomyces triticiradicis]|uniref:Uncharacterized protein n=1 Tax=Streptomyces triticiradicis TaxID=2651189 RepID=A0A7J5D964_9ACTN|nr:hypothetical protein F8144_30110 [Streptomyces triticiradicis]